MSYTFPTATATATTQTLPVQNDVSGATLTVEFSYHKGFANVASSKSVTGSGKTVTLSLSGTEVDSLKSTYYRIKSVKAGVTSYIVDGSIEYNPQTTHDSQAEQKIPTRLTDSNLRAEFVPKWQPNHSYAANEYVLNPSGQIVSAKTAFISSASYSASNWNIVSTGSAGSPPSATTVGVFYVDPVNGNNTNDGRTWQTALATIASALTLCAGVGEIRLSRGVHNVTATLVIPQAVKLRGFGSLLSQETEIVWTGADDGSYVIRTAGDTSGNDFSRGELSGFLLRPGTGPYTNLNGLYARNLQNGAYISNIRVQNFPGRGIRSDWANAAVPAGAFPGWVTFDRVWSTGNNINWSIAGGFTSVLYSMCAGDVSSNTTDVFVLDPPSGGAVTGRQGNHVFIGFKTEDNGTPTGSGATANYFTINSDAAISLTGCSAKRGTGSGTKPWINYTVTPASVHSEPRQIPVTLINCETSNLNTTVQGPGGIVYLAPISATGGEVFQVDLWSSQLFPYAGSTPKVKDSFVRADSTTALGTTERGGLTWTVVGTWGVIGSQAYTPVSTANSTAVIDSGLADCAVEVTFSAVNANAQRLVFRYTDTNNYMFVNAGGTFFSRVAGVETNIGSTSGISWGNGDVMKLVMIGSTLWLYKNGKRARVPLTSAVNQTATMHGIGSNSNIAGRFDDFSVTPI